MKKNIEKIVTNLRALVVNGWKRFTRNLPFRMSIGRLGIKLAKLGRFLQVRYANWNAEFRLQREFSKDNLNYCVMHVSERVLSSNRSVVTFDHPTAQPEYMTPMISNIFKVRGVSEVILRDYIVAIVKARVYSWDEILPQVEAIVLKHLTARN